jgi:hypothetical protein
MLKRADSFVHHSKKMAKSLFVRQRFFSPVMVRGEEESGVRVWGYGKTAYENLLSLVLNPEYGDITDTEAGTDLTLTYGKPPGASFPQTKLVPRRRSTALCEDLTPDKCAELLDSIPDFGGLFERKTTADVQTMLERSMATRTTIARSTLSMPPSQSLALFNYPLRREARGYRGLTI